nr:hypothetical protein [Mycoplasmopsis bovis]
MDIKPWWEWKKTMIKARSDKDKNEKDMTIKHKTQTKKNLEKDKVPENTKTWDKTPENKRPESTSKRLKQMQLRQKAYKRQNCWTLKTQRV